MGHSGYTKFIVCVEANCRFILLFLYTKIFKTTNSDLFILLNCHFIEYSYFVLHANTFLYGHIFF